jgi:hypothetical protein
MQRRPPTSAAELQELSWDLHRQLVLLGVDTTVNMKHTPAGITITLTLELSAEVPRPAAQASSSSRPRSPAATEGAHQRLHTLRRELADEHKVQTGAIASDATLRLLAEKRPQSLLELRRIKGMGQARVTNYGDRIITLLQQLGPAEEAAPMAAGSSTSGPTPTDEDKPRVALKPGDDFAIWKPSSSLLWNYRSKGVLPKHNCRFMRWCAYHGYDPKDVIEGRLSP